MPISKGFTLIELMVAVLILGILGAIAAPAYQAYIQRAACEDGKSILLQAASNMERGRAQNNASYDGGTVMPVATREFSVAITANTATTYTLTATALRSLNGTLTLTAANVKGGSLAGTCNW